MPQKPPSPKRTERRLLMVELLIRVYWFDDALQAGLKANGWTEMTRAQSFVLMNLTVGVKRASQLARNIGVSHQAMSQTLAEMARRGLVTIESDANDRRARLVTVAAGASAIRKDAVNLLRAIESQLAKRIGRSRVRDLENAVYLDWGRPPTNQVSKLGQTPRRAAVTSSATKSK